MTEPTGLAVVADCARTLIRAA